MTRRERGGCERQTNTHFLSNLISAHQSDLFKTVAHSITQCAFVLITHQCSTLPLDKAHKTVLRVVLELRLNYVLQIRTTVEALFIRFPISCSFASKGHFKGQRDSVDSTASCRPAKKMFNLIQALMRGFANLPTMCCVWKSI